MAIDGTWKITVDTPMGTQQGTLELKTEGTKLTGVQHQDVGGTMPINDGRIAGNKATWKSEITQPFAMTLEFEVTVTGDEMKGEVKAGNFGASPLSGKRAS